MKKLLKMSALLALALTTTIATSAMAGAPSLTASTDANINFKSGSLIIDPDPDPTEPGLGFYPFKLNFGQRNIPIRAEAYVANGDGVDTNESVGLDDKTNPDNYTKPLVGVKVTDNRAKDEVTGWDYTVSLGDFVDVNGTLNPFSGTIFLRAGTLMSNSQTAIAGFGTELVGPESGVDGEYEIKPDNQAVMILQATDKVGVGSHGIAWTNDNIVLQLASNWTEITQATYQAIMQWTLTEV